MVHTACRRVPAVGAVKLINSIFVNVNSFNICGDRRSQDRSENALQGEKDSKSGLHIGICLLAIRSVCMSGIIDQFIGAYDAFVLYEKTA